MLEYPIAGTCNDVMMSCDPSCPGVIEKYSGSLFLYHAI